MAGLQQYSRSDVLNRHLVQTHGEKTARAGRPRRAACIACVQDRVVCDGVPPKICSRCRDATRQCRYRHLEMEAELPPSPQVSLSSGVELSPVAPAVGLAALGDASEAAREDLLGLWPDGWASDIILSATNHRGFRPVDDWFPDEPVFPERVQEDQKGFWVPGEPGPITPAVRATMHTLTQHAHRPIWAASAAFPSENTLAAYVNLYLRHFAWLPIVDPTSIDKAAPLLLKAVAGLGGVYARDGNQMMELVRRDLMFITEHDARFTHDMTVVQTTLLASMYGAFSGSLRWAQHAESMRPSLLIDAQASLFGTLPLVPMCEIDTPLPGGDACFPAVLTTLLENGTLPPTPDDLALSVLAHALNRICLDAAAARAFAAWEEEGEYALPVAGYNIHPQALLDQLARHTLRLPAPSALVVSCAGVAYHAHLRFSSARFLDDVKAAAGRGPGSAEDAQARLGGWMRANPRRTRDVMAHAVMLFVLVGQFSFDAPPEAVWLFDSALCMWAVLELVGTPTGDAIPVSWAPTPAIEAWIDSGIGSLAVPGVRLADGGSAVLKAAADRLSASPWGIAARYRRVLLGLQGEQQVRRGGG
ncbi:hypothetical protein CcaverHIS631_0309400 [Cutaneotrichosporon cavernicola]|nr:hypothetical protein CcaverHIS631_0309400 [Cutaneotrichosporon cavernicola]